VLAGLLVYPWEQARAALRASRELIADAPDELTLFDVLLTAPPQAPFPPELQGRRVAVVGFAWCGDLAAGERVLARMRAACAPALDLVGPMPYTALQTMLDETAPHGWSFYDKLHYLPELGDAFVDELIAGFERVPTPQSHVVCGWMGGAIDRVEAGATAFGHRGARAFCWIIGCSGDAPLAPVVDWACGVWDATAPYATGGVCVNALDAGRSVRDAYAGDVWERLVAVKRRYDPDGVFAGNGIG
jgi:FAD/FMN-containing dehydrogenase